MVERKAPL
jgi:hypothetical protein